MAAVTSSLLVCCEHLGELDVNSSPASLPLSEVQPVLALGWDNTGRPTDQLLLPLELLPSYSPLQGPLPQDRKPSSLQLDACPLPHFPRGDSISPSHF